MARITVEDCIDKFESRFELVLVASNRARKLHSGENPSVERNNDKNTVISLREIAEETISVDKMKNNLIEEYQTVLEQNEEDMSLEQLESENTIENNDKAQNLNRDEATITEVLQEDKVDSIDDVSPVGNNINENIEEQNN
tara:strand:- start:188 stop:610 length:423 start_codon:yes stop_codon:yes gene_type:complete